MGQDRLSRGITNYDYADRVHNKYYCGYLRSAAYPTSAAILTSFQNRHLSKFTTLNLSPELKALNFV